MRNRIPLFEDKLVLYTIATIYEHALEGKNVSVWRIAKEYSFREITNLNNSQKNNLMTRVTNQIIKRLTSLSKMNLVIKEKVGDRYIYSINVERVLVSKHKFPNGYCRSIMIKNPNELWTIYQYKSPISSS